MSNTQIHTRDTYTDMSVCVHGGRLYISSYKDIRMSSKISVGTYFSLESVPNL